MRKCQFNFGGTFEFWSLLSYYNCTSIFSFKVDRVQDRDLAYLGRLKPKWKNSLRFSHLELVSCLTISWKLICFLSLDKIISQFLQVTKFNQHRSPQIILQWNSEFVLFISLTPYIRPKYQGLQFVVMLFMYQVFFQFIHGVSSNFAVFHSVPQ